MNNDKIKAICLANGFKLKQQDDGSWDLNEYVYDAVNAVIAAIDPFAKLNFYKHTLYADYYVAHSRGIHYHIKPNSDSGTYFVDFAKSGKWGSTKKGEFTLEQAQAWCQADYDVYYKGLSND